MCILLKEGEKQVITIPQKYGKITVISVKGKLVDDDDSTKLHNEVNSILKEESGGIVINLRNVNWISSIGIGGLIRCLNSARKAGSDLRLTGVTDKVQDIFSITKMDSVLQIFPNVNQAVESFKSNR